MTYYNRMDADEKLMTLRNRARLLQERQGEMMRQIKECEMLYPEEAWRDRIGLDA